MTSPVQAAYRMIAKNGMPDFGKGSCCNNKLHRSYDDVMSCIHFAEPRAGMAE
jgi:hypothetical protein